MAAIRIRTIIWDRFSHRRTAFSIRGDRRSSYERQNRNSWRPAWEFARRCRSRYALIHVEQGEPLLWGQRAMTGCRQATLRVRQFEIPPRGDIPPVFGQRRSGLCQAQPVIQAYSSRSVGTVIDHCLLSWQQACLTRNRNAAPCVQNSSKSRDPASDRSRMWRWHGNLCRSFAVPAT